ncbi:MAG TPA: hemolysin family protein [Gemmatimonadaceae bacterium]
MIAAWSVVGIAAFLLAALLAVVDGALLAAGQAATRQTLGDPERTHRALSVARLLAHLVTGTAIALAVMSLDPEPVVAVGVAAVLVLIHVSLVEGVARQAGFSRGSALVTRLAPSAVVVDILFRPITTLGGFIESILGRAMPPADDTSVPPADSAEQFREVIAAEAEVSPAEAELLHGVFSLGTTEVQEIMVPRVDVVGLDKSTPWSEMVDRVRSSEHARFPVFEHTLDNVLGILYAKDLLPAVVADGDAPDDWSALVRPATFIPATKTIDQQLRDFKAQRTHIALVMDEYGGTQGVVTIEDILEEIVGEIRDEFDTEEPKGFQEEGGRFWVSGGMSLADLSEIVGVDFQREGLTTVGGLVYKAFGRVPRAGDVTRIDGFRVVVERVRRRRVERVYFESDDDVEDA